MKKELANIRSASRGGQYFALLIFLVGMHSLVLGVFIYFFTELFYRIFFHSKIENLFFVKQSGLFLFCLGLFYLLPLIDLARLNRMVIAIIVTKTLAVLFLVTHASYAAWPPMIFLAAAGDGFLAILLAIFYRYARLTPEENLPATGS